MHPHRPSGPAAACGRGHDHGQVLPLVLVAVLLVGLVALGLVHLGGAEARRAAAQASADAAALAGAADGEPAARRVAQANGATLAAFVRRGATVEVSVVRHGVRAHASARWEPGPP